MIFNLFSNLSKGIGIDLGTANVVVCNNKNEILLNEPSCVALIEENGNKIPYVFGKEAKQMVGRTPLKIDVIRPMKDGVISDFRIASDMIKYFINTTNNNSFIKPTIIICVPLGSTPVERRAIQEAAEISGAKEVFLIEEPIASAIGIDLPILEPVGSVVVDIGGGTTEIAIISLGGIVYGKSLRIAGDKMDEAVVSYIRRKFGLLIGDITAEKIKTTIGSACEPLDGSDGEIMEIRGRDLNSGIPKEIKINEKQIAEALNDPISKMIESMKIALECVPAELSSDIVERGIHINGGGALIKNIDYVISKSTGLNVFRSKEPLYGVINGIRKVLMDLKTYKSILFKQN